MSAEPKAVTQAFWEALYARDWERIASFFGPDSIYYDVPIGPAAAAKGPGDIVKRLKLGLEPLVGYDHGPATVVSEGDIVVTEHTEMWEWPTGERATLPFTSIQHVVDGTITRWKDYWDLRTLLGSGPPTWEEDLGRSDLSWMFDATGLV